MASNQSTADQEKQRIAGLFGRAAPTYDRVGPQFFSDLGRRLVAFAEIPDGAHVLDVATGRGALLFPAAEAVGPSGHVTGIDLSEAMVQQTTQELRWLKLENADVRQMDAEDLRFPDASFDFVLCGFAIFFFPQLDRGLAEMRRVLKPNGHIAVATWNRIGGGQWKWFDDLVDAYLPPEGDAKQTSEPELPSPDFSTPEGLTAICSSAGFLDVRIARSSTETVYGSEHEWWSSLWSHGSRATLERLEQALGSDGLERFRMAAFEKLRAIRHADGIHILWNALFGLATKPEG